ncbi:thiamine permease [Aeromicrobium ginsengisoli]|uniref:Thiamine permease n=1 Tax=Aeromicrobium ginsengisoli TaxID=363867 RepID=A0A5M4FEV1_9ACTN|nr:thiamine permease [Aeromicrobium ginsengisoli]KAA1397758.1 thiamine permease [Aeromicrobium ginsengisoli]
MSTTPLELPLPALLVRRTDDPNVVADAARDDYAEHVVPRTWRIGRAGMVFAWSSLLTAMFTPVLAATAASIVGPADAIIGIGVASATYGLINYFMQKTATTSGLTVGLFSRSLFGYSGAALVTIVYALTAIFFAVFEGSVVAVALQTYFGGPIELWYSVVVALSVPLVLGGVRVWLERVNKWLLPIFVAGMAGAVIWATVAYGYDQNWASAPPAITSSLAGPGWLYVFTIYMGIFATMMYTFDFARLGRPQDITFNGWITFGPVFYFFSYFVNGLIGIYLVSVIPQDGVSEIGVVVSIVKMMGLFGLIFIFATQAKINTANLYLASSYLESFFAQVFKVRLPRWLWAGVVGAVMLCIMFMDVFSFILQWLSYQGVVIVAWVAIALVQMAYRSRKDAHRDGQLIEFRPGRVPAANPGGLGAWIISSVVGIALLETHTPFGTTWALPIAFVSAGGIYGLALLFARPSWFTLTRPHDPRDEVEDVWETRVQCHSCEKSYIAVEMDRDPSSDHEAICSMCANSHVFRAAARREADMEIPQHGVVRT